MNNSLSFLSTQLKSFPSPCPSLPLSQSMALRIPTTSGGASLSRTTVPNSPTSSSLSPHLPPRHLPAIFPFTFTTKTARTSLHVVHAKKFTSRTGPFDSKNRRSKTAMKEQDEDEDEDDDDGEEGGGVGPESSLLESSSSSRSNGSLDIELPELPGDKPDFWEGPQWDVLGFVVQYLWAIGIVFALVACGIAVATYNEGATDFKETPSYKESVQSRELLEGPDANSDVFESNPTEVAPSLE